MQCTRCKPRLIRGRSGRPACFHSGGHVCLDVDPNSCIWALPMFSHFVSSAAVRLIQVRYMAQSSVSAAWSLCTSLESLQCLSRMSAGGSPTLHSLTGGSLFPPDLSVHCGYCRHLRFPFYLLRWNAISAGRLSYSTCLSKKGRHLLMLGWMVVAFSAILTGVRAADPPMIFYKAYVIR